MHHPRSPPDHKIASTITCTNPIESDRIPNAGMVPEFSSTDPIREDAAFLPSANSEFADKILFVMPDREVTCEGRRRFHILR